MAEPLTFVDTNVLVYAYDTQDERRTLALSVVDDLWSRGTGALSNQVLAEFYSATTKKLRKPIPRPLARAAVASFAEWRFHRVEPMDIGAASELEERHRLQFWDALIIVAAQRLGASILLSEDLQAGRRFGSLRVVNPFAAEV
jgi:predicted nucleic acid-binding protein